MSAAEAFARLDALMQLRCPAWGPPPDPGPLTFTTTDPAEAPNFAGWWERHWWTGYTPDQLEDAS